MSYTIIPVYRKSGEHVADVPLKSGEIAIIRQRGCVNIATLDRPLLYPMKEEPITAHASFGTVVLYLGYPPDNDIYVSGPTRVYTPYPDSKAFLNWVKHRQEERWADFWHGR